MQAVAFVAHADAKDINRDILADPLGFVTELLTGNKFQFGVHEVAQIQKIQEIE